MIKVYIAGPMRSLKHLDYNSAAFYSAQHVLEAYGYSIFNPHQKDAQVGRKADDIRSALSDDLEWICGHADAVVLLEGWEKSLGVGAEIATAHAIGIPVYTLEKFVEMHLAGAVV